MYGAASEGSRQKIIGYGKGKHQQSRRERKSNKGSKRTQPSCAQQPQGEAELAARGPGEKLTQSQELAEVLFVDPTATLDKFAPKIAQVRDRSAEGCQAQFEKCGAYLGLRCPFAGWLCSPQCPGPTHPTRRSAAIRPERVGQTHYPDPTHLVEEVRLHSAGRPPR